jgi:hypothetical protein
LAARATRDRDPLRATPDPRTPPRAAFAAECAEPAARFTILSPSMELRRTLLLCGLPEALVRTIKREIARAGKGAKAVRHELFSGRTQFQGT